LIFNTLTILQRAKNKFVEISKLEINYLQRISGENSRRKAFSLKIQYYIPLFRVTSEYERNMPERRDDIDQRGGWLAVGRKGYALRRLEWDLTRDQHGTLRTPRVYRSHRR
jgi:hypothetical protein